MCPPEKKSSVRPLPNPPQREGTMFPTKAVSHRVLSLFRALKSAICGNLRNLREPNFSKLQVNIHFLAQNQTLFRSKLDTATLETCTSLGENYKLNLYL